MITIRLARVSLLFVAVTLFISAFFSAPAMATPPPALAELLAKRYDPRITFSEGETRESLRHCRVQDTFVEGTDPLTGGKRSISMKQYRAQLPVTTENRAVIIMPPTGGENILDDEWANQFCSRGIRVVVIQSFVTIEDSEIDLRMYDRNALRGLVAIRQTIDFLNKTGSQSVGILGTSLGALQASFATVIDPRLNTAVFIAGGLGLADIAAGSNEPIQKQLRETRKQTWKLDQAGYLAALKNAIHVDVGPFIDETLKSKKKVLSVIAMSDSYVPTPTQMRLYEAFGRQSVLTFEGDHVDSIKKTSMFKSLPVVNFLIQNLRK